MKKFVKFMAPMAVVCTLLASCNGGQKTRTAWTELEKSVKAYDDVIKEHRIASTSIKAHINKLKVVGSGQIPDVGIKFSNEEFSMGNQDLLSLNIPISTIDKMFKKVSGDTDDIKVVGKASLINFLPYILKLPVSDFILLCVDGFKVEGQGFAGMKAMQWKSLVPTYSFSGSGDSKKLSGIKFTISSVKNFINEVRERTEDRSAIKVEGDMTVTGEMNIDTTTGYVKDIAIKGNSTGFKYTGDESFKLDVSSVDADFKLEFTHSDAEKVNIKYQTIEYNPTFDTDNNIYTFKNGDYKVTQYDSLAALETATGIKANWDIVIPTYDDPIKQKNYFLTDDASKNIGYEGFDYDVYFTQETGKEKYGFVLDSYHNVDSSSGYGSIGTITKGKVECNPDSVAQNVKFGSTVRYNTLNISSDLTDLAKYKKKISLAQYTAQEGNSAYFDYSDKNDDGVHDPSVHIFGSDLYNSKGTYTVTLGIYKLTQE